MHFFRKKRIEIPKNTKESKEKNEKFPNKLEQKIKSKGMVHQKPKRGASMKILLVPIITFILTVSQGLAMSAVERATNMHLRIAGVEPTPAVRNAMVDLLNQGKDLEAAKLATQNPNFINITVKAMAKDWLEKDGNGNLRSPLNDTVATIAGFIRDEIPFDKILWDDVVYTVNGVNTPYRLNDNDHYQQAENNNVSLHANLQRNVQSELNGQLNSSTVAGIMTTRGFAEIYIMAGTNRRAGFQFPAVHVFCKGLEGVMGRGTFGNYIRRDVDQLPSGDKTTFNQECKLCHETNDVVSQAFNHYDWDANDGDGRLIYLPEASNNARNRMGHPRNRNIAGKVDKVGFDDGTVAWPTGWEASIAPNQMWQNGWATNETTKVFNFYSGISNGVGPNSYGKVLTRNDQFPICMVSHAFKKTCYHKPTSASEIDFVKSLARDFANRYGYNMKRVFEETGTYCANQ